MRALFTVLKMSNRKNQITTKDLKKNSVLKIYFNKKQSNARKFLIEFKYVS